MLCPRLSTRRRALLQALPPLALALPPPICPADGALQRDVVDGRGGVAAQGVGGAARSRHQRDDHDGGADRAARALHGDRRREALHGASVVREAAAGAR